MRYPNGANLTTLIASLQACAQNKNLTKGKEIHAYMLTHGFLTSPLSLTSLINMYSKCNKITDALAVFDDGSTQNQNVFAYNAIVAGFVHNDIPKSALESYWGMRSVGVMPDKFTFPCVIKACSDLKNILETRKIHGLLFKFGLELDVFVGSALVHLYLRFGFTEDAHQVFDELPGRDVVLWNAMVNGFAQIGQFGRAMEVCRKMGEEGVVPSKFTVTGMLSVFTMMGDLNNGRAIHGFAIRMAHDSGVAVLNALIDMYGKCQRVEDALRIFEMMPEKDIFSWNSILCVHEQCGDHDGTLRLFDRMLRAGVKPDLVTVTTVLPACARLAALMHGKEIHSYMIVNGLEEGGDDEDIDDVYVTNAVMDMYAKCGNMREARLIFDKMSYKDAASWNIMIMGYGTHGFGGEVLDLFSSMREAQLKPDEVTFVGVLSACSHAGLVSQGQEFLAQMQSQYGVVPTIEHYTCVIDMLGRAGQLKEAYELAATMPIEANPVVWRALLAACRIHGNAALAEVAAREVLELEPEHCGSYVLMSNVYGAFGRYEEVSEVRHTMRQHNVRKTPGCSWIELSDGVHVFVTGDRTHSEDYLIYVVLNSLNARLYEYGYMRCLMSSMTIHRM
ncbi:pentatricopeptide repeat-containing protein At3g14730 [Actinidia eriantha]|uniref:pentatricopeptide repeat-containing protein At3g14730 n=1 Tax=Actinidia eriantha TaxID=165200 RepID=UPI002582D980|nr:pentatricopeptide repeat-containing protein At3g14730 [Actinidia eriantha]XP_057499565.1 pentatricopeptide repeat-containing protein At3g14730 [Actinidia eriantha]